MNRLPDRTGIFIVPLCGMLCGWIAGAMLVHGLFLGPGRAWERQLIDAMLASAASSLGPVGVALVTAALVIPTTLWFAAAYRAYRVRVAADRAMMADRK